MTTNTAPALDPMQLAILRTLRLTRVPHTFVVDHEYKEAVVRLKREGLVTGGGIHFNIARQRLQETLDITIKGIEAAEDQE